MYSRIDQESFSFIKRELSKANSDPGPAKTKLTTLANTFKIYLTKFFSKEAKEEDTFKQYYERERKRRENS